MMTKAVEQCHGTSQVLWLGWFSELLRSAAIVICARVFHCGDVPTNFNTAS